MYSSFIVQCGRNFVPTFTYQDKLGEFMRNSESFLQRMVESLAVRWIGSSIRCEFLLRRIKTKETGFYSLPGWSLVT